MRLSFVIDKVSYKKIKYSIFLTALLVIPLVLFILPSDYFDTGETLCLSQKLMGKECPGCGITRGVMHTLHLEFKTAWGFNKLTFFVLPLLAFYWLKWIIDSWKIISTKEA